MQPPDAELSSSPLDVQTWNAQGKSLQDPEFFSELPAYPDILCLKEVGGEAGQDHWTTKAFIAKGLAAFYSALVFTPSKGLRGVAIVLTNHLLDSLKDVCMLQAGMGLELQLHGMRVQVINVHFRRPKRVDAREVALEMVRKLESSLPS